MSGFSPILGMYRTGADAVEGDWSAFFVRVTEAVQYAPILTS